ncbi:ABC transporter substrate-binding protein, partial [Streptomyces sp. SID8455]|nr:ABC transporter substrate-binding protein [Streptomyces sp. SID8455]
VTLGQGSAETAIALGQTPVGIESYPWGSDKSGYLPWINEAVKKSGDKLPKQFAGGEEIDFEAITELEPDVILAPWSGITQKQYDVLKDIAPTVAYPDQAWSTDWDQQIDIIGKALGRTEDTDGLKTKIEKQLADAAATRPDYKDVTFSYIY